MARSRPINNFCIYRVKRGKEGEFKSILKNHWPALSKAGLTTKEAPTVWRGEGKGGDTIFIELFQWKDAEAVRSAHALPEVMAVWEPMGALTEGMEFIDVQLERF